MSGWEIIGIALMPVTYGFVGWLTNTAALHMTLYPLEFKGIPPYLGWQGIVPRRAKQLALTAVKMLTTHVVKVEEFFQRIKPRQLEGMYRPVLEETVPGIVRHELELHGRTDVPDSQVDAIVEATLARTHEGLETLAQGLDADARGAFNFRGLVMRRVTGNNVRQLVEIFQGIGGREFAFIRRSGWLFGGLLGCVQVGIWLVFPRWWTLPLQGAFVGGITNLLALWMIFRPLHERRLLGLRYQGLFLKRQAEVSEHYAELFAERVLSAGAIMEEVLHRPMARCVIDAVHAEIESATGTALEAEGRTDAIQALVERLAASSKTMDRLVARAMNVKALIGTRMKELSPERFEPILRNAFKEDEHVLIILGAVLGAVVGFAQGLFMLSF